MSKINKGKKNCNIDESIKLWTLWKEDDYYTQNNILKIKELTVTGREDRLAELSILAMFSVGRNKFTFPSDVLYAFIPSNS